MNAPDPIVFVVDDDASFLRALTRLLRLSGFTVSPHDSAAALLAVLSPATAGCVITDLHMPERDGFALQEALVRAGCPLPVIFLTGQGDIPTTVRAMRQGAEDFLTKDAPQEELTGAVRRALARDREQRAGREKRQGLLQLFEALSEREREVLRQVVQGKLNKQIASDLGIHERTVKLHRTSVTRKLNEPSVAGLTRLVEASGCFRNLPDGTPARPAP